MYNITKKRRATSIDCGTTHNKKNKSHTSIDCEHEFEPHGHMKTKSGVLPFKKI